MEYPPLPIKPMLGCNAKWDINKLRYPLAVQEKLDGVRCLVWQGVAYSRTGKLIPNLGIQDRLKAQYGRLSDYVILDGELHSYRLSFHNIASLVMSKSKNADILAYRIFDAFSLGDKHATFAERRRGLETMRITLVKTITVTDGEDLMTVKSHIRNSNAHEPEGYMLRNLDMPYKQGRSTATGQELLKLVESKKGKAIVIDKLPLRVGSTIPIQVLGALVVRDKQTGVVFNIGSGFDDQQRREYWKYINRGSVITYIHKGYGTKFKPRHPVFTGLESVT